MATNFSCNYSLGNTKAGCTPLFSVIKKLVFVPYFNSVGVKNTVALSSGTYTTSFWSGLINQADASMRWYPTPFIKNAVNKRAEPIKQNFDDNSSIIVEQGIRHFTGMIVKGDASPVLQGKLQQIQSQPVGFYAIDKDGNLVGVVNGTNLDPIRLDPNSFNANFNIGIDKEVQNIQIDFDVHVSEIDSNLGMIAASEMTNGVSDIEGLYDVNATFTTINHTGTVVVTLATLFKTALNPLPVSGLVAADFVGHTGTASRMYNVTTAADITITAVSEGQNTDGSGNGVYTISFSTGASASDLLQLKPSKNGFDFSAVAAMRPAFT